MKLLDMVVINGLMEENILEIGKITKCMGKVNSNGQMENVIKE